MQTGGSWGFAHSLQLIVDGPGGGGSGLEEESGTGSDEGDC